MKRLRYHQPGYWHYLMGNYISGFYELNILGTACRETGRQILCIWRKKIESNSKNYKEFYRCR